jgi:hypothetical protein
MQVHSWSLLKEADFTAASRHSAADFFEGGDLAALTFAVFDGITPPGSSKSQAPGKKFQGPNFNAPSWMATTSLEPWFEA